jgi:hypothetical protein
LTAIYEAVNPLLPSEISQDVFVAAFESVSQGVYEVVLDVEDDDFSEYED